MICCKNSVIKLNKKIFTLLLLVVALFYLYLFYYSISGDASIYFVFAEQFFIKPFSYSPDSVSYGATGPLYVLYLAIHDLVFKADWMWVAKISNLFLVFLSSIILSKIKHTNKVVLIFGILVSSGLWLHSLELYEIPLATILLSLSIYSIDNNYHIQNILLSGILPLVRPEMVIVSLFLQYISYRKNGKNSIVFILISYLPLLVYHGYMYINTGDLIPTSVKGRALTSIEYGDTYFSRLIYTLKSILRPEGGIYLLYLFILIYRVSSDKIKGIQYYDVVPLVFIVLYIISPPGTYITRYLLIILPFILLSLSTGRTPLNSNYFNRIILALAVLFGCVIFIVSNKLTRYDNSYDTVLLTDLKDTLDSKHIYKSKILSYEIQAQYNNTNQFISADGIVGGQIYPYLKKEISFKEFIIANNVEYIVTMNGFNYRKIYRNTVFTTLYEHDIEYNLGDILELESVRLKKISTNNVFNNKNYYTLSEENDLNKGSTIRVYNSTNSSWEGHSPFWNSIYKVIK